MKYDWDWRLFLDYLDVMAWPIVVLAVVIVFRGRLRELMGRITQAEGPGFKAQFNVAKTRASEADEPDLSEELLPVKVEKVEYPAVQPKKGPTRKPRKKLQIVAFQDLLGAVDLLELYDEVVMDLAPMNQEAARIGAGMWGLGIQLGTRFGVDQGRQVDMGGDPAKGTLILRHQIAQESE